MRLQPGVQVLEAIADGPANANVGRALPLSTPSAERGDLVVDLRPGDPFIDNLLWRVMLWHEEMLSCHMDSSLLLSRFSRRGLDATLARSER
jgi:hypothetical protein